MPVLAAAGALGVAMHILTRDPGAESRPPRAEPSAAEAQAVARTPPNDPRELARIIQADPDEAARMVANALPRSESDAQRLKAVEIRALVTQGKVGAARARAQDYFERWPGGPDTAALEELTGAHPTR